MPEKLLVAVLSLTLVGAPLLYGGILPEAKVLLGIAAALALALASTLPLGRGNGRHRRAAPLAIALVLIGLLAISQFAPWPLFVAKLVSPEHVRMGEQSSLLLSGPEAYRFQRLSLAPERSLSFALQALIYTALVFSVSAAASHRSIRRWVVAAVLMGGGVQLAVGLTQWAGQGRSRLRGTFGNPNHLAFYLEIALALAVAWSIWATVRSRRTAHVHEHPAARIVPFASAFLFLLGLVLTGSRTGLLVGLFAIGVQAVIGAVLFGRRRIAVAGMAGAAAGIVGVFLLGGSGVFSRLLGTSAVDVVTADRFQVWGRSLELVKRFPLLGTGLGSYVEAFPLVATSELTSTTWFKAHNDPLELLVTGGLVAVAIVAVGAVFLGRRLTHVLAHGARTEDRVLVVGVFGALLATGIHSCMDFGLSLPGNAVALLCLCSAASVAPLVGDRRTAHKA